MPSPTISRALIGTVVTLLTLSAPAFTPPLSAQNDLDAFMKEVVARRDDNWKKQQQQYILDERSEITFNGPGGIRLWGEQRDYTWFLREGFFIRSPLKVNGATVGESDRRKAEDEYLRRTQRRDTLGRQSGPENAARDSVGAGAVARPDNNDASTASDDTPATVDGLIRQSRQPQFVSSAYFMRFKFDEGTYALAGHEQFEGHDVLRVEYYPTKLYEDSQRRGRRGSSGRGERSVCIGVGCPTASPKEEQQQAELRKVMNKVALVTLWIEPSSKQIVKYTFDNVDFDFLPVPWLIKVDTVKASMTMSKPFPNAPNVWLPKAIDLRVALTLAIGQLTFRQAVDYHDYREATVTSKVIIPGAK